MRSGILALSLLLAPLSPARAQAVLGVHFDGPAVSIGLAIPVYPELVQVPGQPVYYAPRIDANYFFFDGMYWVFRGDRWFASVRYDGPWRVVAPDYVPAYVLRVPVRYYRQPPSYFHAWRREAPPRWGEHWGRDWEHRRSGWDRHEPPRPASLPVYAPEHRGDRSPSSAERHEARVDHGHDRAHEHDARRGGGSDGRGHGEGHDRGRGHGESHDRGRSHDHDD